MDQLFWIGFVGAALALFFALIKRNKVMKFSEGNEKMVKLAAAIREGAGAYLKAQYSIVAIVFAVIFIILVAIAFGSEGRLLARVTPFAFLTGGLWSMLAGLIGMRIATNSNARTANAAHESLDRGLNVAFSAGSVMGFTVVGLGILDVTVWFFILRYGLGIADPDQLGNIMVMNGMGASFMALFARVGGGIYTKAADVGADLVGKVEKGIPEDDPRNPATIADNVGDNVGDVAGLGSDLLESYVGALLSGAILAVELFIQGVYGDPAILKSLIMFPLAFSAVGLISCIIGIASLFVRKKLSDNPHRELNTATWISAGLTILLGFLVTYLIFKDYNAELFGHIEFKIGFVSPWVAAALGVISGVVIGRIAEYYTSYDYKPTKKVASASIEGSALTITQGLSLGMISCMLPCVVLGIAIFASYELAGMFGVASAAIGMLSFVAATVSVDTYGPISDNAGGIAEMSYLEEDVRKITDELDSVGNTTAAIGKGFAIGSAALATLSMMTSYIFAYTPAAKDATDFTKGALDYIGLNAIKPLVLVGVIIGAALPFMFSGMLIEAVAKAARKMVEEVRRQFREIKGLLEGEVLPDYKTCIEISSQGALKEMRVPAIFCILFPVVCGFIFGAEFVGGILVGATISAIMLALFTGNAGGAWDNGKKYIETGAIEGHRKGSPAHDAAVVGDTVGDPLKDTVGPSLDILIKIMSTISLVTVKVFSEFNLLNLLK